MLLKWPQPTYIGQLFIASSNNNTWRWNGKAWVSLRQPMDVIVGPTGPSGPSGPTGSVIGSTSSIIYYQFLHGAMDPLDNMNYYIGNISDLPAQSNSSIASRRVKVLVSGDITQVTIMSQISGAIGSSEYNEFKINNYTTGTYSVITSNYTSDSASKLDNYLLSNTLVVSEGDEVEIIWTTPLFSITPTNIRHYFNVYIEF
jgi:hypothetical protein